jgi:Heterokaryon incompatibility protein (HET)
MSSANHQGSADINAGLADLSLLGITPAQGYTYLPLPSKRHIRLLHLLPRAEVPFPSPFWSDAETIHCSIKIISLDEKPEYDALSYTWGNPITVYENEEQAKAGAKIFDKSREIVCNGAPLTVSANLYDALIAIRRVPRDVFKGFIERPRAENIWIDAICINQNDTAERNAQVAIMDQIYSAAQMTIAWLGRDDAFTRPAAQVLQEFCKIPKDTIDSMKQHDIFQPQNQDYKLLGFRRIEDIEWLSVYAFLNRNWFRRAWVLQELVLARRICILSGLVIMDWSTLASSSFNLDMSRWYVKIKQVARFYMESDSTCATINLWDQEGRRPYLYQAVEDFMPSFNPIRTIRGISEVRAGLGNKDKCFKIRTHGKAIDLTGLMECFRYSSSTEPRDKIYALCGLLPKHGPWAQRNIQNIVPDYNKPVEQVYMDAAWFQIAWMNSLDILGHVQDLAATRVDNLPSWVPDYSVHLFPNPVSSLWINRSTYNPAGVPPFSAATGLDFATSLASQPSSVLSLQGVLCDSVIDVAEFGNDRDLSSIMNFLSGLQHVYCGDVLVYTKKLSAEEESDGISLMIKGGYLEGVRLSQG